jgi:L-ascorbate metabolism protein UlaG (beta-lactamase superfamily)
MTMPGDDDWRRQVIERAKELDHEHWRRTRTSGPSGLRHVLSLRLVRHLVVRLFSRPRKGPVRRVPRAEPGHLAVTFVGHATVMLTTAHTRILVDPFLGEFHLGMRRAEAPCLAEADIREVDLVLVSHAHKDHLHLPSLRRLPKRSVVVTPPRCASLVAPLSFARVVELAPGQSFEHADVKVTAVAARHDGRRSFFDRSWRATCGYIVECAGATVYYAGDTAYFSGFQDIGKRMHPDVALLPIAGYDPPALRADHLSPLDAVQAFHDLGAKLLVPVGYGSFPLGYEAMTEPLDWLARLCREHGVEDRLVVLGPGETCHVRGRPDVATL